MDDSTLKPLIYRIPDEPFDVKHATWMAMAEIHPNDPEYHQLILNRVCELTERQPSPEL